MFAYRIPAILLASIATGACGGTTLVQAGAQHTIADIEQPAQVAETATRSPGSTVNDQRYRGVNLAGADFGEDALPGEFGVDYTYPTAAEVDFFLASGMNLFRLPFRWERLQPVAQGGFDADEAARLDQFVSYATDAGATVLLDPHNSARYYGAIVGSAELDVSAFTDLWTRLAQRYGNNDRVVFGLVNEPHDMTTEGWLQDANAAISAIRAAGAPNLILVPGNDYTGAHNWYEDWYGTPNAEVMLGVVDPGDNYAFEVHQYLDDDNSGTSPQCVSPTIGSERVAAFTGWLHENDLRGFLGEFAGADNRQCLRALDDLLGYLDLNDDVWLGWAYWAAGPWWGDDIYEVEPGPDGPNDPQFDVLLAHLTP